MIWLYLLACALIGAIVVVLTGRVPGAEAPDEERPAGPGHGVFELLKRSPRLTAEDVQQVVFDSSPRGYNMEQVDRLLERLAAQLDEHPLETGSGRPAAGKVAPGPAEEL